MRKTGNHLNKTDIKNFFQEYAVKKGHFAQEAGISVRMLNYILDGERNLTEKTAEKILKVMVKYGYGNK